MIGGTIPGWESYEEALAASSPEPLAEEWIGDAMLYSSGTTGRPKEHLSRPLPQVPVGGRSLQHAPAGQSLRL